MHAEADKFLISRDPVRRAFGKKLKQFANAMHDIEWRDKEGRNDVDDIKTIKKALSDDPGILLSELIDQAVYLKKQFEEIIEKHSSYDKYFG